ncbi:MAG TPA: YciI family protein [Phycisphaerales bacterium]|nr:YciI family protein [Phycisphaerales bacterium]
MKYALVIFENPAEQARRNGPDAGAYWASWIAYGKALTDAGVMAGGAGLQGPDTATTVRLTPGKHKVQDGPYPDSKEILGGFYLIDVPDLDAALAWAARVPAPHGCVEVRPLLKM